MMNLIVNAGMTFSLLFFGVGYYFRKSSTKKHRIFMSMGVAMNVISALTLLIAIYLFHDGNMEAAGFYAVVHPAAILFHRILATITFMLMILLVISGLKRKRNIHIILQRLFIPLYLVVFFTGLFFFSNQQ